MLYTKLEHPRLRYRAQQNFAWDDVEADIMLLLFCRYIHYTHRLRPTFRTAAYIDTINHVAFHFQIYLIAANAALIATAVLTPSQY